MNWKEILLVSIKTTSHETKKEIIEIGVCNFDIKTNKKYDLVSFFVKPIYTKVTDHCTKITGVAASDLSDAVSFFDMCSFLKENYDSHKKPWASYGNFAEIIMKRQCYDQGIECPFSDRFLNLRHLASLMIFENEISLIESMIELGIPTSGNTCEDDVLNSGIILAKILDKKNDKNCIFK